MAALLLGPPERAAIWAQEFAAAGEVLFTDPATAAPEAVEMLACWTPPADLSRYPNLKVLLSVGAGVDHMPALPEGIALCRTLAPGIEAMVRDWVVMACLMLHRDMPSYLAQGRSGLWQDLPARANAETKIGILGMGRIGALAAESLQSLGFPVAGWSRSGRVPAGVEGFGADARETFLAGVDILVCLLPLTDQTRGVLNADLFARLRPGAKLVQAGRGAQLDMEVLRDALDAGQISAAMLDVTDPEPLPADHWAWADPRLIVTPHVAARTDAAEGARHALAVLAALRAGAPLPGVIDPERGY